jgi:hypothetical protein
LEIELVHQKLDALRKTEVMYFTKAVNDLIQLLNRSGLSVSALEDQNGPPQPV